MLVLDRMPDVPEGLCTLKLPVTLMDEVKLLAARTGVPRNHIVAEAVNVYLSLHRDAASTAKKEGDTDACNA